MTPLCGVTLFFTPGQEWARHHGMRGFLFTLLVVSLLPETKEQSHDAESPLRKMLPSSPSLKYELTRPLACLTKKKIGTGSATTDKKQFLFLHDA